MSERVELPALYPPGAEEDSSAWTDRLLSHSPEHQTNRQCSIGWHDECSDPDGESCMCLCHDFNASYHSVEGHSEGGVVIATRVVVGRVSMPPRPGEPPTAWAHWVFAYSPDDAKARAVRRQEAINALAHEEPQPGR